MFTPADISQLVGTGAMARGEEYFRTGHVIAVARSGAGDTIVGQVKGSGNKQYVTVVELSSAGEQATPRYGKCSCPVQLNCKHTAAVLLAYLDKQNPTEPVPATQSAAFSGAHPRKTTEWERTFAELLTPAATAGPAPASARRLKPWDRSAAAEIGLQFELIVDVPSKPLRYGAASRTASPEPRLGMRPVIRRDGARWTRTGISWSELRLIDARDGGFPEGHVDVLRSLFGLSKSVSDAGYFAAPAWLYADALPSSGLWAMLDAARRAGLPLLQSDKSQSPLPFSERPATTELTVDQTAKGLELRAAVVVHDPPSGYQETFEPETADTSTSADAAARDAAALDTDAVPSADPVVVTRAPRNVTLLGSPPAGLFTWPARGALGKESRILLARFESPLDATTVSLVQRPDPLTVPRSDQRRFLARVLPALQDRFDAVHLDPEIVLPERPRPSLWLDVTHRPDHSADLRWQWRYATEDDAGAPTVVTVPFGAVVDPALRDLATETVILEKLAGRAPRLPAPDPQADLHGTRAGVGQVELTGMDTALFFTEELPALVDLADAEDDFSVEIHAGATGIDYRLTDDVDVTVTTSQLPDQRDWFDLGVIIRAGQQFVPFADVFKALAEGKSHILLVDGLHFTLDDDRFLALRDLIAEARALQDTMGGPLRINRFQAGLFEELERYGLVGAQAESWRASLGALAGGAKPEHVDPPAGLHAQMRSYQQEGFEWLAFLRQHGLGGVLADDMGLGKTLQALALIQHDRNERATSGAQRRPFLVVAPTSVVGNWAAEARHFTTDLQTVTIHETRARRRTPLAEVVAGADIVVTSYALFRLDFEEYDALGWDGLILDEAQFIKNHQSVAYQCARRLAAPFKLALTGTPLENNLMELWSILSVVSPGLFPSPTRFKEYYARPIENDNVTERLDQLRRRVAPFMLRRTKEVVAKDLPAKQEQVVDVVLNSRHRKLYDKYLQRERTKVLGLVEEFGEHRFEVFRSLTVLRQASLDVSLVDPEHENVPSSKLEVLYEMLEDILAEGHSVLIFSQFTQFLGRVRTHLDKLSVDYSYLDGSTRRRSETIERFTSGETKVFLISLKAGGFGLNLTAADYCILLDPWWNPAAEAQAVDRAHRIGQKRNVMVYRMVSTDTIEEKVMALKASKSKLFASVLDGGAAGGAGLTATDVRELLT